MDRFDIIHKMVKEASDSGVIPKHADLPTYTKVWGSFDRILDIVIKEIEE
jgi:hypothetical protein